MSLTLPLYCPTMNEPDMASGRPTAHAHGGFDDLVGLRLIEAAADHVVAELDVHPHLLQPHGILHGGVLCAVVEAVGSVGAGLWYAGRGQAVGVSNSTDFLRAVRVDARLSATGTPVHQDDSHQLWEVVISADGQRVARGMLRLANIDSIDSIGRPRAR